MQKQNKYEFTVTRQHRWDDGKFIVEITQGDHDWSNPGALSAKYNNEFETFTGMKPAAEAAIEIAKKWKADEAEEIYIAWGNTHGFTMCLDDHETTEEVFTNLLKEAEEFDSKLSKCEECGDILTKDKYGNNFTDYNEYPFCSERCAENHEIKFKKEYEDEGLENE